MVKSRGVHEIWLRLARWCWGVPLLAGVLVFVGWYYWRAGWLIPAGLLVLVLGFVLLGLGILFVIRYERRSGGGRREGRRARGMARLLLSNLVVGIVLLGWWLLLLDSHRVVVENRSHLPVEVVTLHGPEQSYPFGDVAPHSSRAGNLTFGGEGAVHYSLQIEGEEYAGVLVGDLVGYISGGMGYGRVMLLIDEAGTIRVVDER